MYKLDTEATERQSTWLAFWQELWPLKETHPTLRVSLPTIIKRCLFVLRFRRWGYLSVRPETADEPIFWMTWHSRQQQIVT